MHGSRELFSTWSSTDQDLDFCTLLTVLDCCTVEVCSFRNCRASVCCHSSDLETCFATRIIRGMSVSLVSDPFVCSHFSFRVFSLVVMLTSLEVSQFTSHTFQVPFQHQGGYRQCISWLQHARNFESISVSFTKHRHSCAVFFLVG